MEEDKFAPSLSVQAHTLARLADEGDRIRAEVEKLCSALGHLTQQYFIINEAMKETLKDMNGGVAPLPLPERRFPSLNHYDTFDLTGKFTDDRRA